MFFIHTTPADLEMKKGNSGIGNILRLKKAITFSYLA
jgi:hypothetical protein